ncbi:OLC1v1014348C2 [Oldenlandia corymbosa var. corymbosa]|uniref:OLC1v1014348C2 n=1 Tax=Oldenlandia corymbosa var. corymbosa TaxID=529605 RepID=A0AAV1E0G3_OLDCO|nr:OLC1v1014348C2 [Oldenlandia corymbosa var. corymbosa]
MASVSYSPMKSTVFCRNESIPFVGLSSFPLQEPRVKAFLHFSRERVISKRFIRKGSPPFLRTGLYGKSTKETTLIPRSNISSNSNGAEDGSSNQEKTPFGYTRKDVLLIGVGVTALGYGLKYGLEFFGVDPLQAGNVVQLVLVLGLTVGWISTYIFRVSNKEMTYAQQLRDYESKVMEKRLESLTEAELQVLLQQIEEEKTLLEKGEQGN